jgi:hypothetical protein
LQSIAPVCLPAPRSLLLSVATGCFLLGSLPPQLLISIVRRVPTCSGSQLHSFSSSSSSSSLPLRYPILCLGYPFIPTRYPYAAPIRVVFCIPSSCDLRSFHASKHQAHNPGGPPPHHDPY